MQIWTIRALIALTIVSGAGCGESKGPSQPPRRAESAYASAPEETPLSRLLAAESRRVGAAEVGSPAEVDSPVEVETQMPRVVDVSELPAGGTRDPGFDPTAEDVVDETALDGTAGAGSGARWVVLLDPGHGGYDLGAEAFDLNESVLALEIALRTRDAIERLDPSARVLMTREDDTFVSLEQRSAMANAVGANVFVSIHLNSADEPVRFGGVTSFVLDTSGDRQAVALAARENGTSVESVGALAALLAGLERREQARHSTLLAQRIQASTLEGGRTIYPQLGDRGVRRATFSVLVGTTMPAALIEVSFLTFEPDATALRAPAYRRALANGLARGIVDWAQDSD